ncbi:MAG: 16S rRNA (cytosine(1402)-N(4))-methyltransferase RsmH [Lachnospiraceae bacterium]|nr:16S rRNA (cytosine(1402)-N(4))-methyltransferase RsmH [Lachnospiraceae bacterium]
MVFGHTSVLLEETIEGLHIKPEGIYVDGTLGGGGHSERVAEKLMGAGRLVGIDQDEAAIHAARERLSAFGDRVTIVRSNYRNTKEILSGLGITKIDGMLLDLGVSSYQLDTCERGFSYRFDAPLDMRMDARQSLTARDIVNNYDEMELYRIIKEYGEDKFAKNIARHIVMARQKGPLETTGELNEVIKAAIPARMRAEGGHPSKRTFQAIRIECNRELEVLKESLEELIELLKPEGRLCIITFHSLEDRIVKTAFKGAASPCTCPPGFPVCVCGKVSKGRVITGRPIVPGEEEQKENSRSKSAKLRIFEKA